jgi:hypothetical protein
MKSINLAKAEQASELAVAALRAAHTDAIQSGNQFAEIVTLNLLNQAADLQVKLAQAKAAALALS